MLSVHIALLLFDLFVHTESKDCRSPVTDGLLDSQEATDHQRHCTGSGSATTCSLSGGGSSVGRVSFLAPSKRLSADRGSVSRHWEGLGGGSW